MPGLFNPESVFQAVQDITELVGSRGKQAGVFNSGFQMLKFSIVKC